MALGNAFVSFQGLKEEDHVDPQLVQLIEQEAQKGPSNVNLANKTISRLPSNIGSLIGCERLGLNNNLLTSLPSEINQLVFLRYLNLRSNRIREFPPPLLQLNNLEVLDISKNKIKRFPSEFGGLMHLKVLSVSRNRITHLPKYIAHMQQLKVFKLEHNPFQWPPEDRLECTDEAQHPQWLEQLKQWILANDPPIVPVHPAIARIRESSESSIDSKPPDTVQQYLIEHANKPPHSPLVLASHHMIHACKKLDLISNLISQLTSEGHLNLEKETKHIQRELQQMVLVLVKRDSPHLVLKALVKHLHAFMKSLDLVLPKSIDNPAFDLHLNLEWHQCNRHISQAISCLSADSQELSNALQNIKRECDKRGLAKGVQLVTDMEKQPKTEDLITLLTFLKDRRLLALGLELTKAAKKLL